MFSVRRTISSASASAAATPVETPDRQRELHDVGERVHEAAPVADIAPHVGGGTRGRDRFIEASEPEVQVAHAVMREREAEVVLEHAAERDALLVHDLGIERIRAGEKIRQPAQEARLIDEVVHVAREFEPFARNDGGFFQPVAVQ